MKNPSEFSWKTSSFGTLRSSSKGLSILDAVPFRTLLMTRILGVDEDEPRPHEGNRTVFKETQRGSTVRQKSIGKEVLLQDFLKQELDLVDDESTSAGPHGPYLPFKPSAKGMESLCFKPYTPQVPAELTPDLSLLTRSGTAISCSITP